jgi:hypothetical protein
MHSDSQNHEDQRNSDSENRREFEEMMERWGIQAPEEPAKPLGIDRLIENWCEGNFERPKAALKELKEGQRHSTAAAALFAYCYTVLSVPLFGLTLDQCLKNHLNEVKRLRDDDAAEGDQEIRQILLELHKRRAVICRDLVDFVKAYSSEESLSMGEQDNAIVSVYVSVLLTAARALIEFSGETKRYDAYLHEELERAFDIIRRGKVQQAEQFSNLDLEDQGHELRGPVEGFLACLGCAVVCYSLAWMESELSLDHQKDYETAFRAYVHGARYMRKTGYRIGFIENLFASESERIEGEFDIYWKIIGVWAELRKNPGKVQNWRELRNCLTDLEDIMLREDHQEDWGHYPSDEPGFVYLPQQMSFCDGRLSHEEILELIDQRKQNQHEVRLRNDFFEGLWQYLEEDATDNIVRAEHRWYDNPTRESRKAAFIDYSNALEIELRCLVFGSPDTQACVTRLIKSSGKKEPGRRFPDLTSKKASSLYLGDISRLLQHIKEDGTDTAILPIGLAISNLPDIENVKPGEQPKALFASEDFIRDLGDIYQIRNVAAHSLHERPVLSRLNELRRRILGIGCTGYLIKLAEIKRSIRESKQSQ